MRSLPPLLALALLFGILPADAAGTVLVSWAPVLADVGETVEYDVFGLEDGAKIPLGTTSLTSFPAPDGYGGYQVKFRTSDGETGIPTFCIVVDPNDPNVGIDWECSGGI